MSEQRAFPPHVTFGKLTVPADCCAWHRRSILIPRAVESCLLRTGLGSSRLQVTEPARRMIMGRESQIAVVMFCGDVRREEKAKGLPARFLALVHDQLRIQLRSIEDVELLTASSRAGRFSICGEDLEHHADAGSLSDQVESALECCFSAGYKGVILFAGDVVLPSPGAVVAAVRALRANRRRTAVGRSSDGGFYLAGFNRMPRIDWTAVLSRPESAAESLLSACAGAGEVLLLPTIDDIDSREDALRSLRQFRASRLFIRLLSLLSFRIRSISPAHHRPSTSRGSARLLRGPPVFAFPA